MLMVLCTGKKRLYSLVGMHKRKYINTVALTKSCIHSPVSELHVKYCKKNNSKSISLYSAKLVT